MNKIALLGILLVWLTGCSHPAPPLVDSAFDGVVPAPTTDARYGGELVDVQVRVDRDRVAADRVARYEAHQADSIIRRSMSLRGVPTSKHSL